MYRRCERNRSSKKNLRGNRTFCTLRRFRENGFGEIRIENAGMSSINRREKRLHL